MSKKLTRAEACAELARRMNWENVRQDSERHWIGIQPGHWMNSFVPSFFTSRDAAAELVAWIYALDWKDKTRKIFIENLEDRLNDGYSASDFQWLLATPEQITLAACSALGIEVE